MNEEIRNETQPELPEYEQSEQMERALGEMMQINTPILDFVRMLFGLPAKFLLSPIFLLAFAQTIIGSLFELSLSWEDIQELGTLYGTFIFLSLTGAGIRGAIRSFEKEATESPVRKKLSEIFRNEGLIIHSYKRNDSIPDYLVSHSQLMHEYNGAVGGDMITLHYRGYAVTCCNIALTQPRTPIPNPDDPSGATRGANTYVDQYEQDDIDARARFTINEGQDVVFYGSVFIFMPGPDIEGYAKLEAADPIDYLNELKSMDTSDILTNPERAQDKKEFWDFHHRIYEEEGGAAEVAGSPAAERVQSGSPAAERVQAGSVLTNRVRDMVLQLELRMRAPVGIYADQNMVCMSIQSKVLDFDSVHSVFDSHGQTEMENTLLEKVHNFRKILDIIIGPKGDEYTELLGLPATQRSSVYKAILNPAYAREIPSDEEIRAYVDDLVHYSADVYRFFLRYSGIYQKECGQVKRLGHPMLTRLYSSEDKERLDVLIKSEDGKQLMNSLEKLIEDHFRTLWGAAGKYSVKSINRVKIGRDKEIIKIEVSVFPPIREWNSKEGTDRLVDSMGPQVKDHFKRFSKMVFDPERQRAFLKMMDENLRIAFAPKYDSETIYTITMTLLENDRYGFTPNELVGFQSWYTGLLMSNMKLDGEEIFL